MCQLDTCSRVIHGLGNWLLGAVKLTKNVDPDKYWHSGYGIRFYPSLQFS